jgi:hypothetical protein
MIIRTFAYASPEDVEKAVLPAIIFINTNHETFEDNRRVGFYIAIGWWHYAAAIGILF